MKEKRTFWRYSVATLTSIVALGAIIYSAWTYHRDFEGKEITMVQYHMSMTASSTARSIEEFISECEQDIETIAQTPLIQRAISEKKITPEVRQILEIWARVHETDVDAIYLLNSEGTVLHRQPFWEDGKDRRGTSYAEREDIAHIVKYREPYINVVMSPDSGRLSVYVSSPVDYDNEFVGIARWMIVMDTISERFVKPIKVGQEGYAYLLNDKGIVLYHPGQELINLHITGSRKQIFPEYDWHESEEIVRRMTKGEGGAATYHSPSWTEEAKISKRIIAFAPINIGNRLWSIGLSMDYSEKADALHKHERNTYGFAGLLSLLLGTGLTVVYKTRERNAYFKEQLEKYQSMISEIDFGFYTGTFDGRFRSVNQVLADMLGYDSPGEIMGMQISELYIRQEDGEEFLAKLQRDGSVHSEIIELRKKDGTALSIMHSAHAGDSGISCIMSESLINTDDYIMVMCANCGRIREGDPESGVWMKPADFLIKHRAEIKDPNTDYEFSHGICPICTEELYGDLLK